MPLTHLSCEGFKKAKHSYKRYDSHGLYLEVMPNGSKYWRFRYRFAGKEKRLAFFPSLAK